MKHFGTVRGVAAAFLAIARRSMMVGSSPSLRATARNAILIIAAASAIVAVGELAGPPAARAEASGLEHLVPELAEHPYALAPGARRFRERFAFSPGFGNLGTERLFSFRFAYNPNQWLGWEGAFGHNPGQSVHAVLHSLSAQLRHPFPGRFQPYASLGYGMVMVFPGRSINADPVTKNALMFGGGLEFYIRDDLALRGELRRATVFGQERDREGVVAYDYVEQTIGLTFYRTIRP